MGTTILEPWQKTAAKKRASLSHHIAQTGYPQLESDSRDVSQLKLDGLLSAQHIEITDTQVEIILHKLAIGEWASADVTEAFCRRAVIAHGLVNCLNEVFFDKALESARKLDEHFARTGKPVGPLHGLPISLKNQCCVRGIEMNMCYVGQVGHLADKDSHIAAILQKQGAVLFTLTNLSQGLLSTDTVNNLYGRTVSPFNRALCVGGSSGGEGALIAMKGSPLGIGSDLGGSVRIPAAFNGLYGLRPSSHRVPYGGSVNSQQGQETNASCLGPLSNSCIGLKLLLKAVLDAEPWEIDPLCLRMPFKEYRETRPLCFAIAWDDGRVVPHPPYRRALCLVQDSLRRKGHSTIDWHLPNSTLGQDLYLETLTADGGGDIAAKCALSGELVLGGTVRGLVSRHLGTLEWWDLTRRRKEFLQTQLDAWNATAELTGTGRPVDGIIMPVAPYVSFKPGEREYIYYTAICNLSDYPAVTFPVTRVQSCDTEERSSFLSDWDQEIYKRYDVSTFINMPVGLQVVGRKGTDEQVLRMAEIIDA